MTDRQKRRAEARRLAKKRSEIGAQSPKGADVPRQEETPNADPVGGAPDTASVLRASLSLKETSPAQVTANQANSLLSTGPRTDEGKAISAQNNFRHGLTQNEGELVLLEGESKEAYARSLAAFQAEWKPATATEHDLVERLASRQWLRRRAMKLQNQFLAPDGNILDEKKFALYRRYEIQHERAYNKALADLMRLHSLRLREQNGFESQKRKDEIHAFKIKALQDREYRNKLAVLESEARLTLAQGRLIREHLFDAAPNLTHSDEIARQANS